MGIKIVISSVKGKTNAIHCVSCIYYKNYSVYEIILAGSVALCEQILVCVAR